MERVYIILGLTPQGLALLRELGKAGAKVFAFCTSKRNVGYHSKYGVKKCYSTIGELKNFISEIISEYKTKPICYISSGEILASILADYKTIYDECDVYSGPYPIIEMLAHKDKMYEYAQSKGLKIAKYRTLDKYSEGDLKYPIFLKRNYEIPLFFKAVKISTPEEFNIYNAQIQKEDYKHVIAQEFIDIPTSQLMNITCQGFFVKGECMGIFIANQTRRLKKGITSYIEELPQNTLTYQIQVLSENFMKELKYCGFAEFEFMYDTINDCLYFVEVNTRTCGSQSVLHHKFTNISDIIINPSKPTKLNPKPGMIKWMNIQRDVRARIEEKNYSNLGDIFHSCFDIFDWNDLNPFIRQFI